MRRAARARKSAASAGERGDGGAGLVGTLAGFVVFLAFLFLAVQTLVDLYATSVVTAVTYDAARMVATARDPDDPRVRATAEAEARRRLGPYGDRARFAWAIDGDTVRVHVHASNPRFVLPVAAATLPFDKVDRTAVVRVEQVR
jgi:hypothetical protein